MKSVIEWCWIECRYMILEFMGAGELFDMIQSASNLTEKDASSVCRQVGSALAYCHKKGETVQQ